jgi:hypothetical protein
VDLQGSLSGLTASQIELVSSCIVSGTGPKRFNLADLAAGWTSQVNRLQRESLAEQNEGEGWNEQDYVGALHLRNILESGIASAPPRIRDILFPVILATDTQFESFTTQDIS